MTETEQKREQRRWHWTLAAMLLAWVLTFAQGVWVVSADHTSSRAEADAAAEVIEDHETRIRHVEREVSGISTDVKWIRNRLERMNP